MYITLEVKTILNSLEDQNYYNIYESDIFLNSDETDYDYDTDEFLEPELFKNIDGEIEDEVNIGSIKFFCYDSSSINWDNHSVIHELLSYTDGEDINLGRVPIYFSPVSVLNEHFLVKVDYPPETWEIEQGRITRNTKQEPSEFIIHNMVNRIWHMDYCGIKPKYRGQHNFGKQAYGLIKNSLIQSGEIITTIPHVPMINRNEQRKKSRTPDKTNKLLLRYWNSLGFEYYDPRYNILWGFKD